jgi:uncharacterized membrane protein
MVTVWLKALHISTLVIWCSGILMLPTLFAYRPAVESKADLWRLQRFIRFTYTVLISPAAFVAVISGTVLIFMREVFTTWFAAKLAAVGLLTILHLRFGYIILHLFEDDARYQRWRMWLSIAGAVVAISTILWLVLAKPPFELARLPNWLLEPGGLQSLSETIKPIP